MAFINMTDQEYKEYLDRLIIENPELVSALLVNGHADTFHEKQTDDEMILRSVKEKKSVSQFLDYTDDGQPVNMTEVLDNCLLYKSKDIAEWMTLMGPNILELEVIYDGIVGYGYQKYTQEKMDSPAVRIILQKGYRDQVTGFYVNTAYIDLEHEQARYERQFKCYELKIDPYRDGKLTIDADKLDLYRTPVMTKAETEEQIKSEMLAAKRKEQEIEKERDWKILQNFSKDNGISMENLTIEKGIGPKGFDEKRIRAYGKTVGFIKRDTSMPSNTESSTRSRTL